MPGTSETHCVYRNLAMEDLHNLEKTPITQHRCGSVQNSGQGRKRRATIEPTTENSQHGTVECTTLLDEEDPAPSPISPLILWSGQGQGLLLPPKRTVYRFLLQGCV